jgi:hypothetical protein
MGLGIRYFLFEESGKVVSIAQARMDRLLHSQESLPRYAGQRVRIATLTFETDGRKLVSILRHDFWAMHLRKDGFVDEEKRIEGIRSVLNMRGRTDVKREGPVVDINPKLDRRRFENEYRWKPTAEEWLKLDELVNRLIR